MSEAGWDPEDYKRVRPIVRRMSNGDWSWECFGCQTVGFGRSASAAGDYARVHMDFMHQPGVLR